MNGVYELLINLRGLIIGNGATDYDFEAPNSYMEDFVAFNLLPQIYLTNYTSNGCGFYWKDIKPNKNSSVC
jgi:hypothetical protein